MEPGAFVARQTGMVQHDVASDARRLTRERGRGWILVIAAVAVAAAAAVWGLTRSGDPDATVVAVAQAGDASTAADSRPDAVDGEIRVELADVDGIFFEGFEVGLRFETVDGSLISSTLWSDHVASTGRTDMDAYYDSVLSQSVPAGTVRVNAEVNIGQGPGPSIPDLAGPLPCVLDVEVDPGAVVTVEVGFDDRTDCMRQVADVVTPSSTSPSPSTATAAPPHPTTPSTSAVPAGGPSAKGVLSLGIGTSHYVDVDLECQAFELAGVWVLVEGDTSTWQSRGERHEGGMFTISSDGRGRFVGDAKGDKVATFGRLAPDDAPACSPVPRGGS